MNNFIALGAGRCVRASEILCVRAAKMVDLNSLSANTVVHNLCDKAPAKTVVICNGNVAFLSNFSYKVITSRVMVALEATLINKAGK